MDARQRWQILKGVGGLIVGTATLLATLPALGVRPDQLGRILWPWLIVAGLLVVSVALLVIVRAQKVQRPEPHRESDQRLLDAVFRVLPREVVRMLAEYGFASAWPSLMTFAPMVFYEEFGEVEHHFFDIKLEAARANLHECADAFETEASSRIFPVRNNPSFFNTGYASWEIHDQPELQQLMRERQDVLSSVARRLVAAHTEFVRVARTRGFNLDGLSARELHPRLEELRDRHNAA